jgi:hypothetical protein
MSLRNNLIRLAAANPELRADLLLLLKEQSDPASHDQNKPEAYYGLPPKGVQATARKAHGPVALIRPEVMLYAIDPSASAQGQSKFYEMVVAPYGTVVNAQRPTVYKSKDFRSLGTSGGFFVAKRWGRLTDRGGVSGRFDGMDEYYDTEADARAAMTDTKRSKMTGSGSARYNDVSRSREYPIGLGGSGFGWGGQSACVYIPELQSLLAATNQMTGEVAKTRSEIEALARKDSDVGRRVSALTAEISGKLDELQAYLSGQLQHCR